MSVTDQSDSKTYKQGQSVESRAIFRDVDGELVDPSSVVCSVLAPSGSPAETSYTHGVDEEVVRESEGVYHFWIATPVSGLYRHKWTGEGPNVIINWREFYAEADPFEA